MFKGGAHKELRLFCTIIIPCHTVRRLRPRIRIYRPVRLPLLIRRHLRRFPLLPQLLDRLAHRRLLLILCDLSGQTDRTQQVCQLNDKQRHENHRHKDQWIRGQTGELAEQK